MPAMCHKAKFAPQQIASLFDYLISENEECGRDSEAKCLRSFEIDDKFEFGLLEYWKVGWFVAFENLAAV